MNIGTFGLQIIIYISHAQNSALKGTPKKICWPNLLKHGRQHKKSKRTLFRPAMTRIQRNNVDVDRKDDMVNRGRTHAWTKVMNKLSALIGADSVFCTSS